MNDSTLRRPLPAGTTTDERTPRPMADDGRTYIRVHDGMPDHPKVDALTDRSFRLLVEAWCWCSRHLTDGHLPAATWARRGTPKARRELIDAGLVEDLGEKGVQMHDYLQHQRSRSEVQEITSARREAQQKASVKGNHNRWHRGPDGRPSDDCPLCQNGSQVGSQPDPEPDPDRDPNGIGDGTPFGSVIGIDTDIDTVLPEGTLGGGVPDSTTRAATPTPNGSAGRPPERCPRHAGQPDPGPCRSCGDARQRAERWDADTTRARIQAVRACRWCDGDGWRVDPDNPQRGPMGVRCDHTPLAQHLAEASR